MAGASRGRVSAETQRRASWLIAVVDPVRLQILRALSQVADATASELAVKSQTSHQTLRRHLEALEVAGVICVRPGKSDGETPGRPAARFSLSPEVRESVCSTLSVSRGGQRSAHRRQPPR